MSPRKRFNTPSSERNLTKLLVNKLRRRALSAVHDEPCDNVTELIDVLTNAFGIQKTIDQYKGDLSTIYLKPNEHILDFISQVKDLRSTIIDADRREHRHVERRVMDTDMLTARLFCEGLPLEYRLQLKPECYVDPFKAFSTAKIISKRLELDKSRYGRNTQGFNTHPVRPIGPPVAHSTMISVKTRNEFPKNNPTYNNINNNRPQNNNNNRPYRNNYNNNNDLPSSSSNVQTSSQITPQNFIYRQPNYYGKQCDYCKRYGHLEKDCRKKKYCESQGQQGNEEGLTGRQDTRKDQDKLMRPVQVDLNERKETE
jgi:hypothetical protein